MNSIKYNMDYNSYQIYLGEYNKAVQNYSMKNNIDTVEVVELLALGELKLNEVNDNA